MVLIKLYLTKKIRPFYEILVGLQPIGSMGRLYILPTWMVDVVWFSCR